MKKVNDAYFILKLNESKDNQTKKIYCELINKLKNFDKEHKIEKYYHSCKIYYESLNIFPTLEIAEASIAIINYFLNELNYSPLPKTIFYLNSILLMTFKLLLSSNNISDLIILYSKYLSIIKDNKIKEIIKENKSVKYTKNKIKNLFKEGEKIFQEQLNTRKIFFSILITENKFQESNKIEVLEFFDKLETQVKNVLNKNKKETDIINDFFDFEEDKNMRYVVNTDWLYKFLGFKKFLDKICKDIEAYKYFLFTGFDANNVILNVINNYSTIKNNIVSYIGPIINKNIISNLDILIDPDYEYNNFILSKDYTYINERLYLDLSDFFGIDFELKREKKYLDVKYKEIMILNNTLRKKDISSICKEIISFEDDLTYDKLKLKIIRCIKYKYDIDFSNYNINIYISEYNNKNIINEQNFILLNAYGFNLVDNLYIKCSLLNSDNFNLFFKNEKIKNIFIYIEIIEKENNNFFILSNDENICALCKKKINENILLCDENEKCLNKYCSSECKYNDKKHINYHSEINKYFIQNISIEKLLDKNISFEKESKLGLTGLINTKNNCYVNSVLQCLSNCFQFTKYFLSDLYLDDLNTHDKINDDKISKFYKKFLEKLWKKNLSIANSEIFIDIFAIKKNLKSFEKNDASEFLIFLLDSLHNDLNRVNNKEYIKLSEKLENETESQAALRWWKNHLRKNDSIIVDLFQGQIKNKIICEECKYNSIIFDPFMILPLNIPQGKINISFKYFGYNYGDYHEFNLNLNLNEENNDYKIKIVEIINNYFNDDKKNNKNKKKKINKKKNKNENNKNNSLDKNDNIIQETNTISIELILLTKNKKIFKILDNENNINIFDYINQGFELVAYEKEDFSENIYFYLVHYTKEYLLWSYPYIKEHILFEYPLPLSIKSEQNIFNIYQKIFQYLYELTNCTLDLNNNINFENEKKIGFLIYIDMGGNKNKIRGGICAKIFNYFKKTKNKIRILKKFNIETKYAEVKENLKINENKKMILNIDLLINLDEIKLPAIEKNNFNCNFNKLSFKKQINIYDCLDLFISQEKIDENIYYCSKCKKRNKFTKKMDLYKEPYYLIIHLNRYKINQANKNNFYLNKYNNIKNECFIDFPIQNLDLTEYFIQNEQKKKYNLIGVINHYGESFNGHYTSYCLNRNNWYCFDDETITEINKNSIVTDSAFILFYQKVN